MIDIVALAARSPLGTGDAAWSVGAIGAPAPTCIKTDEALVASGMRKPNCARAVVGHSVPGASTTGPHDPATALLLATFGDLERHVPQGARLGLAIGTSSGGMATSEKWFSSRSPDLAGAATYHAPFRELLERVGPVVRSTHPVTACSASTLSILIAMRWLQLGEVDYAIAGGYDALTVFVAAGFEALGATTASPPPKPFRKNRDGMALGEACGLFLLARPSDRTPIARILGAGASGDAVHLTAPDRTGGGLARAAQRALGKIDPATIDLVSVHGTSTPFNDPMESKAIATALGRPASTVAVHAGKASIGHTLGAAGALETALAIDCLRRQVLPATAGDGELDEDVGCVPRAVNESGEVRAVLKLSAAFGGANAALVLARDGHVEPIPPAGRASDRIAVTVDETDDLDRIASISGVARERLARMDGVCRLALLAVGALAQKTGREGLKGAGIVLGTALATIDVNAVYDENIRKKGAAYAEGRRFAYTTPNAAAGECAMAFDLTGPNLAVSRGPDAYEEANEIARDLIRAGDASRVVVVEVDSAGPAARAIASATGWPVRFGATARLLASD